MESTESSSGGSPPLHTINVHGRRPRKASQAIRPRADAVLPMSSFVQGRRNSHRKEYLENIRRELVRQVGRIMRFLPMRAAVFVVVTLVVVSLVLIVVRSLLVNLCRYGSSPSQRSGFLFPE